MILSFSPHACYRSYRAVSGEVLEDGVGVSTDYYCHAYSCVEDGKVFVVKY